MAVKSMQDMLVEELREIYDAERHAARSYFRFMRAATSLRLKEALENHVNETREQVSRLERVFAEMKMPARAKSCAAVRGFIADAEDRLRAGMPKALLDAALIAHAQKIEHFEIAAYGTVQAVAQMLGREAAASLLKETLEEEKAMDKLLNQIALREVNKKAMQAGEAEAGAKAPAARRKATGRRGAAGGRGGARRQTAAPRKPASGRGRKRRVAAMATAANKPGTGDESAES